MKPDSNSRIIRRHFEREEESMWILLSNKFVNDFLFEDDRMVDIPITALRIIANIISTISGKQFQPENSPRQLSLFEEEFETENNVFAQIKIKNIKISPSRSHRQIIDAYEFLAKYKMGWYSSVNSQGKPIKTFGGLITAPSYDQRGYTTFLVSSFWLKKLLMIPEYNRILFDLVYELKNNRHVIFAIWLNRIPLEGTTINLRTLNSRFGLNYTKAGDFCSKFLRPLKHNLDKISDISFNFNFKGDKIYIKPYKKGVENSRFLTVQKESKKDYRLSYYKNRFKLSNEAYLTLKEVYKDSSSLVDTSYSEFVKDKRKAKIPTTLYTGKNFLQELQIFIVKKYRETKAGKVFPDGYPKLL